MAQLQAGESLLPHYEQVLGQLTALEVCAVINCKFYPSYVVVFEWVHSNGLISAWLRAERNTCLFLSIRLYLNGFIVSLENL